MIASIACLALFIYICIVYLIFSKKIQGKDLKWKRQWEAKAKKNIKEYKKAVLKLSLFLKIMIWVALLPSLWICWFLIMSLVANSFNFNRWVSVEEIRMALNILIMILSLMGTNYLIHRLCKKEAVKIDNLERQEKDKE